MTQQGLRKYTVTQLITSMLYINKLIMVLMLIHNTNLKRKHNINKQK